MPTKGEPIRSAMTTKEVKIKIIIWSVFSTLAALLVLFVVMQSHVTYPIAAGCKLINERHGDALRIEGTVCSSNGVSITTNERGDVTIKAKDAGR